MQDRNSRGVVSIATAIMRSWVRLPHLRSRRILTASLHESGRWDTSDRSGEQELLKGGKPVSDMVGIVRSAVFNEASEELLVFSYHLFYLVFIHHS